MKERYDKLLGDANHFISYAENNERFDSHGLVKLLVDLDRVILDLDLMYQNIKDSNFSAAIGASEAPKSTVR